MASAYFVAYFSGGHQHFPASFPLCTPCWTHSQSRVHLPLDPSSFLSSCYSPLLLLSCVPSPSRYWIFCLMVRGAASGYRDETLGVWEQREKLSLHLLLPLPSVVSLSFSFFICNTGTRTTGVDVYGAHAMSSEHGRHSVHSVSLL